LFLQLAETPMLKAAILLAIVALIAGIIGFSSYGSAEAANLRLLSYCAAGAAIAAAFIGYAQRRAP
jgi:hypothetical protein